MGEVRAFFRRPWHIVMTVLLTILITVPVTIAVLRPGYASADLTNANDEVWAVNSREQMVARVNERIEEFTAGVPVFSDRVDVFQAGDEIFVHDDASGWVGRLDPGSAEITERVDVPPNSHVAWQHGTLAILERMSGKLWVVQTRDRSLQFDQRVSPLSGELGPNAQLSVTAEGQVFAFGPGAGSITRVREPGAGPEHITVPGADAIADFEFTTVGDRPVIFDRSNNLLRVDGDKQIALAEEGMRLQETGPKADAVLVATSGSILKVPFDGEKVESINAQGRSANKDAPVDPQSIARPVQHGVCSYGAWGMTAAVVVQCIGQQQRDYAIPDALESGKLVFRTNGTKIALNNVGNGNVYLPEKNLKPVKNWGILRPEPAEGVELPQPDALAKELAQRGAQNHAPQLRGDVAGVRPGQMTLVPVLTNDEDSDGDVLTITQLRGSMPPEFGTISIVGGGTALQVEAAETATGEVTLEYLASDGRAGGIAQESVTIRAMSADSNRAPVQMRVDTVPVGLGQEAELRVLPSWQDPDGDPVRLVSVTAPDGVVARFEADGTVSVRAAGGKPGLRSVAVTVSDGSRATTGFFVLDVRPADSLPPSAMPDFAFARPGENVTVRPLDNDASPSGQPLRLTAARALDDGLGRLAVNPERGEVNLSSPAPGTYYIQYDIAAGEKTTSGLIRFDVQPETAGGGPQPILDTAWLAPMQTIEVDVLANDTSPRSLVLAVTAIDTKELQDQPGVTAELVGYDRIRLVATNGLRHRVAIPYTVTDGEIETRASLIVEPIAPPTDPRGPSAENDTVTVPAGGLASVDVLANDTHPDGVEMHLDPNLLSTEIGTGKATVAGDRIWFKAPDKPGNYTATYSVTDAFQRQARAEVTFTVTARDPNVNAAPNPPDIEARVGAGGTVRIDLPPSGLDADGDLVALREITGAPKFGRVLTADARGILYEANADAFGTDEIVFDVIDGAGERAEGRVRIAVVPTRTRSVNLPPVAADDIVRVRPGIQTLVLPLQNDADSGGRTLALVTSPEQPPCPVEVVRDDTTAGEGFRVTLPEGARACSFPYLARNADGQTARAFIHLIPDKAARIDPPRAEVIAVSREAMKDQYAVDVDVRSQALSQTSPSNELQITPGSGEEGVSVTPDGKLQVEIRDEARVVSYQMLDARTGLKGTGFVIVPGRE